MEKQKSEDELRKRMTKLLKKGNKLLAEYCPKCGSPLFLIKNKGLKYCPKCNVYLASREDIEREEIDRDRIYDFDSYWENDTKTKQEKAVTKKQSQKNTSRGKKRPRETKTTYEEKRQVHDLAPEIDRLLQLLLKKLESQLRNRQIPSDKLVEWLKTLMEVRNQLKG